MKILAVDTTTSYYSVAITDDDHVLAEINVDGGRKHSERLMTSIIWLLEQATLSLNDIDMLAVAHGPGSFTGLRIGVSACKGLALGAQLPMVGVSTLDAMTRLSDFRDTLVCPLLDAKMNEVYGAVYRFEGDTRTKLTEEKACPVEEILGNYSDEVIVFGEGASVYRDRIEQVSPQARFLPESQSHPRASTIAIEAIHQLNRGACSDAAAVHPVYLRKSQAEQARAQAAEEASTP